MTIATIRAGLAVRLATIQAAVPGFKAHATWPDGIIAPCCIVGPPSGEYHVDLGDTMSLTFDLTLYAYPTQQGSQRGQDRVDPYLDVFGAQSIKYAIESEDTLGGIAHGSIVRRFGRYDALKDASGAEFWGAVVTVEVMPK